MSEETRYETRPSRFLYTFRWYPVSSVGGIFLMFWGIIYYVVHLPATVSSLGKWGILAVKVLGSPFLFAGVLLTFGPLLYNFLEARNVAYRVTNRRVLVRRGLVKMRDVEIFLDRIAALDAKRSILRRGAGSVKLMTTAGSTGSPFYMRKFPSEKFRGPVVYVLDGVKDVDVLIRVLEEAVLEAGKQNLFEDVTHQIS